MNSITSEIQNFQCTICLDNNTENPTTTVYGHCHPNTEIGKRAQWIHVICQNCFTNNDTPLVTCIPCKLKNCDTRRISLNAEGVVSEITSRPLEIQNKIFIKQAESLGNQAGRIAVLTATLLVINAAKIEVIIEAAEMGVLVGSALEAVGSLGGAGVQEEQH